MRIFLCVHSAERGGAELMALEAARYFVGRGHELKVSIPEGPLQAEFSSVAECVPPSPMLPLWGGSARDWAANAFRTPPAAYALWRRIRRWHPDVVVANSSVLLAPALAARAAHVPSVVHLRDWPASRFSSLVIAAQAATASRLIAISKETARLVPRWARHRVRLVADGVRLGPDPPPRAPFHDPLRLLVVGGLDPRKGQDIAVRAAAELQRSGRRIDLRLVGRETAAGFEQVLTSLVAELGLSGSVSLAGQQADLVPHLDWADVLVVPSRGDFTPLSVMEAVDRRLPVVATSVGSLPELVRDGATGWLVNDLEPSSVAIAIAGAADDQPDAVRRAHQARGLLAEAFDRDASLRSLEQTCLDLQSSGSHEPCARFRRCRRL